ncbi:hypothetical protein NKG05_12410 [Oerskovia sp. M15]
MNAQQGGVTAETLASISTPDLVETRLGTLEFDDGAPSEATAALLYDNLDFMHGVEAFINSFPERRWRPCVKGSWASVSRTTTCWPFRS